MEDTDTDHDSDSSSHSEPEDTAIAPTGSNNHENIVTDGHRNKGKKGNGRPHLKDCDKMRVMFLFADLFRRERGVTTWIQAAQMVSATFSKEFGHYVGPESLRKVWRRLSKPVAEQKPIGKRGGARTRVTDEFKEQLIFVLADPDIPAEQKSLRKIVQFLPDCPISRTTLRRVFKEIRKDQIVPKPPKPPRRRKPAAHSATANMPIEWNGHS